MADVDPVWLLGFAVVLLLALGRFYYGPLLFGSDARHWQPFRLAAVPIIDALARRYGGADFNYAETEVYPSEYVTTFTAGAMDLLDRLAAAGYEPQPLASLATDWTGTTEAASWARYMGPKPFPGAPDWLRPMQVHARLFPRPALDGTPRMALTAHYEPNPWRPDTWRGHYRGIGKDAEKGVSTVAGDLGVQPNSVPDGEV